MRDRFLGGREVPRRNPGKGLQVFYTLDDPLVERLCKLVCETIVEEAQEEIARQRKLLDGWGGKAKEI